MYDIIVVGAGPSGIACAISASRLNNKVLLIENEGVLGGTNILSLVGPLMTFHNKDKQVIGGIANEIVERLISKKESLGHIKDPFAFCSTITPFTFEGLKALYFRMMDEENIDLLLHTRVIGVNKEDDKITSLVIVNNEGISTISGKVIIDATGNGDVCYLAKEDYTIGRSSDSLCQPLTMPFVIGGVDFDKIKEAIKNDPDNFDKDDTYDYDLYVGVSGFFKEVKQGKANGDFDIERDRVLLFQGVNKTEAIINTTRVLNKSSLNGFELSSAERIGRRQIEIVFNFLRKYIPGFENSFIATTPVQIGIRESRHIHCSYIIKKEDIINKTHFDDTVVVGAYPMDIHSPVGATLEVDKVDVNDLAYEIPLRSMIPLKSSNLLVTGRCLGATHEAAASLRVTPIVMALGEACGVCASLAQKVDGLVKEVNPKEVQDILLQRKMVLDIN